MNKTSTGERLYTLFHQLMFLLTGLITTLGTQWIFYRGAATADSYFLQLSQYFGMILVGLLIPTMLKKKTTQYTNVPTHEEHVDMDVFNEADDNEKTTTHGYIEGKIQHSSIIKMSILDIFANFCVTVGFSIVGSGVNIVIWCAILTYFLMGRLLTKLQWIAIFGTSTGLAISALGHSDNDSNPEDKANAAVLLFGTLLTIGGTFFYDYMLSKQIPPPLPARICSYVGLYTSTISLLWIAIYTLPRLDQLIHIDDTPMEYIWGMYILIVLANAGHSWNYYELIDRIGSVSLLT
ncbi:hypothetical protein BJ944DRAFT_159471 [Cunninghamella echinulata]|nr:hypothetical protein BJ944DRAFT_159471 [Cunninghamella echinulata]